MRTITVARKPLGGTVAKNILKHGTGGLNIKSSRIGIAMWDATAMERVNSPNSGQMQGRDPIQTVRGLKGSDAAAKPLDTTQGRWPANIILQHNVGCQRSGPGGEEEVAVWSCQPDCPIAHLDGQSGMVAAHTAAGTPTTGTAARSNFNGSKAGIRRISHGDTGTASRFFKQTAGGSGMVPELLGYLTTLIAPPAGTGHPVVHIASQAAWVPSTYGDGTLNGIIVQGTPTPAMGASMLAKLKPGAHLLCMAPSSEPTGHTGACNLEDAGFEIRDAMLLVDGPTGFHYTPKATRAEREVGTRSYTDTTAPVANAHPTVKPVAIMAALVAGAVGSVLDPFVGSGTTGIACLAQGTSCTLVDQSEDYLRIADARIRHADAATAGWNRATIISEVEPVVPVDPEPVSLLDFFAPPEEPTDANG